MKDDAQDIPKAGLVGTRSEMNLIGKYPDNQKRMWTGYYASVAFMDAQQGILDELDRLVYASTAGFSPATMAITLASTALAEIQPAREVTRVPPIIDAPVTRPAVPERWLN